MHGRRLAGRASGTHSIGATSQFPPLAIVGRDGPTLPGVRLVRDATVADLFVVRNEWRCYHPAEIASITNTLANSRFELEHKVRHDEETTTTTETQTTQTQTQSEQDQTQTELTRELARNTSVQAQVNGSVSVSGQYGIVHFGANASAGFSSSLAENVQQASKVSHDMLSRAASTVESRVREERVQRLLTRTKDRTLHVINNEGNPNANAVYRWVDRVDRYQVFRFPNRLQLEFQIPEPSTFLRWRRGPGRAPDLQSTSPPPVFDVDMSKISRDTYGGLALKFRAQNLPPPPDAAVSIVENLQAPAATAAAASPPDSEQWNVPDIAVTKVVTIPPRYVATSVDYAGVATPIRGVWHVEYQENIGGQNVISEQSKVEGFHFIKVSVLIGADRNNFESMQIKNTENFSVQVNTPIKVKDLNVSGQPYNLAFVPIDRKSVAIAPPARTSLSVAFSAQGAASLSIGVTIGCKVSDEAMAEWQAAVYGALLDAWQSWSQAYTTDQLRQRAIGGPNGWDATSPERNAAIIRDEFKRQVITWLLRDEAFAGRDAMVERETWDGMDLKLALQYAPEIQFFEQAFEWGNMSYVCYPYYWARAEADGAPGWAGFAETEAADPRLAEFLRAGSARVVVPARPGMEDAVKNWLIYGELNLSGPLPVPGDIDYLSVAQELRDMTAPLEGGEPGPSWELRVGTTLLWLDQASTLPVNTGAVLGKPPNQPIEPMCEGVTPLPGTGPSGSNTDAPSAPRGFLDCIKSLFGARG